MDSRGSSSSSDINLDVAGGPKHELWSLRYRWYVVLLLTAAFTLYAADRILLSVLVEPIKTEFGASDSMMGLVNLLASISYSLLVIPMGLLADRINRRRMMGIILAVWSLMTAVSGFARNIFTLSAAQMVVAANASGGLTTMNSLISDLFERKRRGFPIAVWYCGIAIGGFVGFSVAGYVAVEYGWRATFFLFGIPGLIIALLVWFTVRDTPRGMADGQSDVATKSPGFGETIRFLKTQTALKHAIFAQCLSGLALMGPVYWLTSFFMRTHELSLAQAGFVIGIILLVAGICSNPAGGFLMDRLGNRDLRWPGWLCAILMLAGGAAVAGMYLVSTVSAAFAACVLWQLITNAVSPITVTMISNLASAQFRGLSVALGFLLFHLMGFGAGAQIIGSISDWLAASRGLGVQDALRVSCLMIVVFYPWAAFHFWMASRHSEAGYRNAAELERA